MIKYITLLPLIKLIKYIEKVYNSNILFVRNKSLLSRAIDIFLIMIL